MINKEAEIILNKLTERGWMILNGSYEKEGEWIYIEAVETSMRLRCDK